LSPTGIAGCFLLILLLLYASAVVSGSEVAFFSLTPNNFADLEEENTPASIRILRLKEQPHKLLATILICNNFINVAIAIVSDFIVRSIFSEAVFENMARGLLKILPFLVVSLKSLSKGIRFAIVVVGVTFLLVLFGEVAPKIYAKLNNVRLAKIMSGPLTFMMRLLSPFSRLMVQGTNFIERHLEKNGSQTSKEEIGQAIELTVSKGKHARQEIDILKSIVKFGDVAARQIMRSRVDVTAVDFRISFKELLEVVKECGFSRIPVFKDDFDHVTGILYVKDLIGHLKEEDGFEWQKLIRTDIIYVPESKKIDDLLKEFQAKRFHMAIVVDEYGGSSGIVTLHDILEEILGEIKDEFDDDAEVDYKKINSFTYLFEGKTLLNDACRIMEVETDTFDEVKGDSDSIAGLFLEIVGMFPKVGQEVTYKKFKFKIVAVTQRRIEQILVTILK